MEHAVALSATVLTFALLPACFPASPGAPGPVSAAAKSDAGGGRAFGDHLLLTEIRASGSDEFIEIENPTASTVSLGNYYLTDMQAYPELPAGTPSPVSSDFMARFPAGATIAAGQVIVVALRANAFAQTYGKPPDYGVVDATGATAMVPVVVGGSPSLTDSGEMVALFYWDGNSDLVSDVDLVMYGSGISASNRLPNKTGVAVDGPDSGTATSTYARDAFTMAPIAGNATGAHSYQRIALEGGSEIASGGNGITGHDETSENLQVTWDTGGSDATPGTVPPSLRTGPAPGPADAGPGMPDAASPDARVPDAAPPDGSTDGTPTRRTCTNNYGTALTQTHGRIDGYLVSIVPASTSSCNGDSHHLHLQVEMNGGVYDVAINIYDKFSTPINHELYFAEDDLPLPDGAWSEGWHPGDNLDYASLGLSASSSQFSAMPETQLRNKLTSELANVNHISIFMTGYNANGGHDVHRKSSGDDGAIFLEPLSGTPHALFFHFYGQSF